MATTEPATELHREFSSDSATPTPWSEARQRLEQAEVYWLTTVRPDGRPHVTPVVSVWDDGALYFSTGPSERKADNLAHNSQCIVTTGCNAMAGGLDIVIEGAAGLVRDEGRLQRVADRFTSKYEAPFNFSAEQLAEALVYELVPTRAFGYGRGESFSATRYRF